MAANSQVGSDSKVCFWLCHKGTARWSDTKGDKWEHAMWPQHYPAKHLSLRVAPTFEVTDYSTRELAEDI